MRSVTSGASCSSCLATEGNTNCAAVGTMPMRMCPATPLPMAPISRLRVLDVEAHALGPLQQHLPGSCEADAAAGLLEQGGAAVFLEPPHAARQRRLRAMQPRRRASHVLQLGDGLEVAEVAQVHSKSPI